LVNGARASEFLQDIKHRNCRKSNWSMEKDIKLFGRARKTLIPFESFMNGMCEQQHLDLVLEEELDRQILQDGWQDE
jgi:hypothetical protein